jgi:hypothetical protein
MDSRTPHLASLQAVPLPVLQSLWSPGASPRPFPTWYHGFQGDVPSCKRTMVTIPRLSIARPPLVINGPKGDIDGNTPLHPGNRWSMSVNDGEVLYFHHHVPSISDLYVGPLATHPGLQRTNWMYGQPCLSSFWVVSYCHAWISLLLYLSTAIAYLNLTLMIL